MYLDKTNKVKKQPLEVKDIKVTGKIKYIGVIISNKKECTKHHKLIEL